VQGGLTKLLSTIFGLNININDMEAFLVQKMHKKIIYQSTMFLSHIEKNDGNEFHLEVNILIFYCYWGGIDQGCKEMKVHDEQYFMEQTIT
jgi:hypothetical protein